MSNDLLSLSVSLLIRASCFVCISHRRRHHLVRYRCITLYAMETSGVVVFFFLYNDSFNIRLQWHQTVPNVIQGHKWHKSDPDEFDLEQRNTVWTIHLEVFSTRMSLLSKEMILGTCSIFWKSSDAISSRVRSLLSLPWQPNAWIERVQWVVS